MDAEEIAQRLRLGEDSRHEFKSVARNRFTVDAHDLAKVIASMANGSGGRIFLGVEDGGQVTGVGDAKQADRLMQKVVQTCSQVVQPLVWCSITKVEVSGQVALVVEVPPFSPHRPHMVQGKVYIRDANVSREGTREDLIRIVESASSHFDHQVVEHASLEDLDIASARSFLRRISPETAEAPDLTL
jgi:ATP-dependent DNA helicase RecG